MRKYDERASKTDLYARVKLAPVNDIQRAIAVSALRDADALTDGILWVLKSIRGLFARTGSRPLTHKRVDA